MSFLTDGFQTRVTFSAGSLTMCEKEVTPPNVDGGGPNDTTTMCNQVYRTKAPKHLLTLGAAELTVAYDPIIYQQVVAMFLVNQLITVTFPDASTLQFYGWVDKFKPNALKDGEQPTAMITIEASNMDNSGNEVAPVYAA